MITVKNLEKYYNKGKRNEQHVLNGVNIEFETRGLVCILGESGSGKTTLLNTLGGLDTFASGSMEIDGNIFDKYRTKAMEKVRNDTFGYIFQNYYLLQDYTVLYNVKLALNTFDISEEEKEERALYVLEKLDMAKYKKKLVSQLSGGQQQRVSIARALVKSPKIILADEPTGNLDEENTLRTMSILKSIAKECLVILVSHEKRIANFFADRIIEIQDGKIIKDYHNRNQDAYQRMDDGNIYLKGLECTCLENEDARICLYQDGESDKKINLNFAWKNGKLYIQNMEDYDVLIAGEEVGCEMLDMKKPDVEITNVEEFEFSLPRLKKHKTARLSRKEIWKMTIENIRLMGKKQAFMIGILLITAVMLTITLANFTNNFFINEREEITEDSHYVTVDATFGYEEMDGTYSKAFSKFAKKYAFSGEHGDIYKTNAGALSLQYDGFAQLQSAGLKFEGFSYVSLQHVKKKDLLYGRLPKTKDEIVIDKWLIDKIFDTNSPFHELFKDTQSFLNQELISNITDDCFRIVGISDKGEPSIYMDQYRALGLTVNGYRIASLEQLRSEYSNKFDKVDLKSHEVLVTEFEFQDYKRRGTTSIRMENGKREYKIVGSFPDEFGVDYVLCDEDCMEIRNDYIIDSKGYKIYTDDVDKMIQKVKKDAEKYKDEFSVTVFSKSMNEAAQYRKEHEEKISSRNMFAVAAVLVSVFMIYFMIKSNVSSRTEELTVYRLLGIDKKSIMKAYLLEMFLITSYTVLPAVLITSGVIKFVGSIPSLELQMNFPWWAAVALIIVMYLVNLLISMVPVRGVLSKPPATLAAKKL